MAKKKQTSKCPCCKQQVKAKQMRTFFGLPYFNGIRQSHPESYEEIYQENIRRSAFSYQWACDDCIKQGKAIKAKPEKQSYPFDEVPYFAYYNIGLTCATCKDHFSFSKEEQKFWYEDLQFVVLSKPINCKSCRDNIRAGKDLNTELSDLLKEGKPDDIEKLRRIVEIYQEMGKVEKMKAYLKAVHKLEAKRR